MKTILLFTLLAGLFSCTCLPQIPPQYLPANESCEAYLPNYWEYISVINPCGDVAKIQEPAPGTILGVSLPHVEVTLTAINSFGNTDIEIFDVYITAYPEIIWDSIPGDTLVYRPNDIDLLFDSVDKYREYLGAEPQDNLLIRRLK